MLIARLLRPACRTLAAMAVALMSGLGHAPGAAADGDPASDVLLGASAFYPYNPPKGSLQKTLEAELSTLKRDGLPLKVAIIGSPVDLGVVPDLFGHPQRYANFLDQEISFQRKQALLVVMPAGYGATGVPPRAGGALGSLPPPSGKGADALTQAAIKAVARMGKAEGRSLSGVPGVDGGGLSGRTAVLLALIAAAVTIGAVLGALTLRRRAMSAP